MCVYLYSLIDIQVGLFVLVSVCLSFCLCLRSSEIPASHYVRCFSSVSLQQLRANIREMDKLCARVRAEDAAALEKLVQPVRARAITAARDFLLLHANLMPPPPPIDQPPSCVPGSCHVDEGVCEETIGQIQLHLPEIPADQSAAESWDDLEEVCMNSQSENQSVYFIIF